ncbi:glutathione S-transferase family protein [Roseobacter sinensis]|uniref:Glutathione S-transferase family protein n=1 Tax=Roseobacter sinensis TaxID=2931391 RepID=A0ABT3BDC1_9RHOB|nr:glutathione S-transferase family protein [Roseobacter sp. WL0113]MCV3271557.1 glutathione S-transferase family protein [Roseobacter sp. WL0113]
MSGLTLYGYRPSVYTRVIRLVLAEKGLRYRSCEVNPFDPGASGDRQTPHPFTRVPVLDHDGVRIYETAAIARYLDAAFPVPPLTPGTPIAVARMAQVVAIVDAYGYWPLVRQVFGHGVFRPRHRLEADPKEITAGLAAAEAVLDALEAIAVEGTVLTGAGPTLADCHLAPMIAAFAAAPQGRAAVARRPALSKWWQCWATRPSMRQTDVGFDRANAES